MEYIRVVKRLYEISEQVDQLKNAVDVLNDLARHAETVDTYNRCSAIRHRLLEKVNPLADEFYILVKEYERLRKENGL